jgi:hypothetical protein
MSREPLPFIATSTEIIIPRTVLETRLAAYKLQFHGALKEAEIAANSGQHDVARSWADYAVDLTGRMFMLQWLLGEEV